VAPPSLEFVSSGVNVWLNEKIYGLLQVNKEVADDQKAELQKLRSENQLLRTQLTESNANFRWLTTRVNALEVERAQLLERAYNVKTLVPEIVPQANKLGLPGIIGMPSDLFEDVGEKAAKELGLPVYEN
jgi:hypothetical protein